MRVLVVGATGTIGQAVADALSDRHEVLKVGHRSGDLRVDITETASIERLFASVGRVDALVSAAGSIHVGPFAEMTEEQMRIGVMNKLLGQINLARLAIGMLSDGGSITLSSGLASRAHRPGWAVLSAINAGLEAFGRSAATDVPRGIRVNVVSPGFVLETVARRPGARIEAAIPAAEVARAYVRSVEGGETGAVLDAGRI
jgi:NAD(P)-dependent dehydrogenase (short-subunit alcohol dehydrogenase family)